MLYSRIRKLNSFFVIIGLLLVARLFHLQVWEGQRLAIQGLNGRTQEVAVDVARGEIFDRNGVLLTDTVKDYCITVFPSQIADSEKTALELASLSGGVPKKYRNGSKKGGLLN